MLLLVLLLLLLPLLQLMKLVKLLHSCGTLTVSQWMMRSNRWAVVTRHHHGNVVVFVVVGVSVDNVNVVGVNSTFIVIWCSAWTRWVLTPNKRSRHILSHSFAIVVAGVGATNGGGVGVVVVILWKFHFVWYSIK
jgi:uncharacterized protein (DUF58 family)